MSTKSVAELMATAEQKEKPQSFQQEVWQTLSAVNVNALTEKKNGLTYLSWAQAVSLLREYYPESDWQFQAPHVFPDGTGEIWVTLNVRRGEDVWSVECWLPILDYKNAPVKNFNAFQVNTTRMRCLTKAMGLCGLGMYIYAGEDTPSPDKPVADQAAPSKSVAAAVLEGEQIDHSKRDEYIYQVRECLEQGDQQGWWQLYDELQEDHIMAVAVWEKLQSKEKSELNRWLKAREE